MFQGAIGPDGPTGEMGIEGKAVRILMSYSYNIFKKLATVPNYAFTRVMAIKWHIIAQTFFLQEGKWI